MTVDTAERPPIDELGLLDTSVVVQLRSLPVDALPAEPQISAVTLTELTEEERSARQAVL
jgi:hypothetical protein